MSKEKKLKKKKLNMKLSQDIFTRSSKLHWFTGQQMRALAPRLYQFHPHAYCTVKVTQQACLNILHHESNLVFSANTIGWLQLLNNNKLTKEITRRHILMLPLTRNIFRQTATSFNNTTKRWEQESYYIQIKWWRVAVCDSSKQFTPSTKWQLFSE